jgi:hypothetical protein
MDAQIQTPKAKASVKSLGDLMVRLDEIDHETYDSHVDTKRTQQRIANNRQRLEVFKLAFKAGILKAQNDHLTLPEGPNIATQPKPVEGEKAREVKASEAAHA